MSFRNGEMSSDLNSCGRIICRRPRFGENCSLKVSPHVESNNFAEKDHDPDEEKVLFGVVFRCLV